jgi:phytoene dehydrogenase-like protein
LKALKSVGGSVSMSVASGTGTLLSLGTSVETASAAIRPHSGRDASRWSAFATRMHKFAEILCALYQLVPPDIDTTSMSELLPLALVGRKLRAMGRNDMTEFLRVMPMSVQDLLDDTFESELLKAAIASSALRDIQQGPRSGGTTFNLLHYMVGAPLGAVRSRKRFLDGPDAFATAAAGVAKQRGAEIRTNARVEQIVVRDGAVTGVVLSGGEEIACSIVVSTADPKSTLLGLVDPAWLDPDFQLAVTNAKMRGCTAFVLYAIDRGVEDAARTFASPVSLTPDTASLEKAADAAKYGEISQEPHVEFFVPTMRWANLAPAGKHILVARAQFAPYRLKGSAWDASRTKTLGDKVTTAIARMVPGFEQSILHQLVISPVDLETRFGVTEGALTQGELTLDQILFMRPVPSWGHYRMPIDGLYLGGAGAHPGPGILGGAGLLAARAALKT